MLKIRQAASALPIASPTATSDQQVLKKEYRTVYQTLDGQQVRLLEVLSPLMELSLDQIRNKADNHEPAAIYELARRYMRGEGVSQNPGKGVSLLKQAVEVNSADAQNDMAALYDLGRHGYPQDRHKAFELYQKAAEQGHPLAQYNLASCYYQGEGTTIDYAKSMLWFQKAADQGYLKATVILGLHYTYGHGVAKDTDKALELFHQAANQGEGSAFYAIGKLYDDGNGVTQDYHKAVEWYRKGEEVNDPECLALLGVKYDRGEGVPQDLQKMIAYYRKAADLGVSMAQYNLGRCYYDGYGVEQDYHLSANWIMKAAKQNYPQALAQLSTMYSFGRGVDLDYATAYQYANKAAHLGDVLGIFNIGQYYEHGIELERSDIKAYAHYFITQKLEQQLGEDDSNAIKGLNSVKARLSPSQIQAAEQEIPKLMQEYGLQ